MRVLKETQDDKDVVCHYMERVLHCIFFLGHINKPKISPDKFLPDGQYEPFKAHFPKAFVEYDTHLPRFGPYSILLEYMVNYLKPESPVSLLNKLVAINKSLWIFEDGNTGPSSNDFMASVVAYCCVKDPDSTEVPKMVYGCSMSCKGSVQKEIMIGVSALHVWDRAISYAVYSEDHGPITFPEHVHCYAYNFNTQRAMRPCNNCVKMFVVNFHPEHQAQCHDEKWPYGNCAENESLSRLLQSDQDVRKDICIVGDNGEKLSGREEIEDMFKEKYEETTDKKVRERLAERKFKVGEELIFFTPSYSI
ncbi:uncharacterized protein RB166_010771 [Leptodactylus fuscus]|uniref:uncharacterized protein LOC142209260 n=1 Tax=Leptodactylus fuscus TaxID=238119 RepID=UPI003F4E54DD